MVSNSRQINDKPSLKVHRFMLVNRCKSYDCCKQNVRVD